MPDILGTLCKQVQNEFGDYIVESFKMGHSPDTLCHCLGQCRVDSGQEMCHFYPKPSGRPVCPIMNELKLESVKNDMRETLVDWCKDHQNIEACQGLINLVDGLEVVADRLDRHVAAKDDDNDGFSDIGALRGYWWKGTDFEDEDNQVYPGRFPDDGDEYFDSNCNYLEGRIQDPGRSKARSSVFHYSGFSFRMNAFLMLKIASSFQAAANHSSGHQRSLFFIDLESKFHELFKNAIKD